MVLESLDADALVNIRNLTIESPKPGKEKPIFDLERDVSSETWQKLSKTLKEAAQSRDWGMVMILGGWMSVIAPEKMDTRANHEFKEILDQYDEALEEHLETMAESDEAFYVGDNTGSKKITVKLDKAHIGYGLLFGIESYLGEDLEESLQELKYRVEDQGHLEIERAFRLVVCGKDVDFVNPLIEETIKYQNMVYVDERDSHPEESSYNAVSEISLLAMLKVISPSHFKNFQFDPEMITLATGRLKSLSEQDDWQSVVDYVVLAAGLKILTAESIQRTDNGLELTMPQNQPGFQTEPPPLPEVRRF